MNNQSAVAVLLHECERALDTLLAAKAGTAEGQEREYRRCQGELSPGEAAGLQPSASPQPCPIFPLRADECQEMPGFRGHEWDAGYRQAGKEVHFVAVNCCQF